MIRCASLRITVLVGLSCLVLLTRQVCGQADWEARLRAFTPQRLTDIAQRYPDADGNPQRIQVVFTRADLDGTGKFDFVVAGYNAGFGGTLRVLRETEGHLVAVADADLSLHLGGGNLEIEMVDIENDGKPEIAVRRSGATASYSLKVFRWTGNSLALLTVEDNPLGNSFGNAELFDVDGDGVLEIVVPPSTAPSEGPNEALTFVGVYKVYKLMGTRFQLASTSSTDPTGRTDALGDSQDVLARRVVLRPARFSLQEISHSQREREENDESVSLRLGNLAVTTRGGTFPVTDVDPASLVLGRNIRPLSTRIRPTEKDDWREEQERGHEEHHARFQGSFLEARFSRRAVLQFLPRLQLNKPLERGDTLTLEIRAKMKNGAPVFSSVAVNIVGGRDEVRDEPRNRH